MGGLTIMQILKERLHILLTREQMAFLLTEKDRTGESLGTLVRRWIDEHRTKKQKKT
jgi:hypothetical protein